MLSKNHEKIDSFSRKNIHVSDILKKSRDKVAHKQTKGDKS